MIPALNKEWVDHVIGFSNQQHLNSIWLNSKFNNQTFEAQCEAFFWILEKILESGQLRLIKDGNYLIGDPKGLVQRFRDVFPKSDTPYPSHPQLDASQWFFDPQCPGEAVWRYEHPDGRVQWMN
jgi:hypothetical protein